MGIYMRVITKKQYKKGQLVELNKKRYLVLSSVDLKAFKVTTKQEYLTVLKGVNL